MDGHGRSRKVKEGQGRSWMVFSHHWIDISGEKSYWWWVVVGWVACRIIVSAPVPFLFLWTLDLGFGIWIWDLDLGLDLGLTILVVSIPNIHRQIEKIFQKKFPLHKNTFRTYI